MQRLTVAQGGQWQLEAVWCYFMQMECLYTDVY